MKKIKPSLLIFALLICNLLDAQIVDSKDINNKINDNLISYLIQQGELDKKMSLDECLKQITIIEVVRKYFTKYHKDGIYSFSLLNSPSVIHLYQIKDDKIEILNIKNLSETLQKAIKFLEKLNLQPEEVILYIKEIIKIYEINRFDLGFRM